MKSLIVKIMRLWVLSFLILNLSPNAYAYIEPGTASYILQLIIGALIAGLIAVKVFWNGFKSFFAKLFFHRKKPKK